MRNNGGLRIRSESSLPAPLRPAVSGMRNPMNRNGFLFLILVMSCTSVLLADNHGFESTLGKYTLQTHPMDFGWIQADVNLLTPSVKNTEIQGKDVFLNNRSPLYISWHRSTDSLDYDFTAVSIVWYQEIINVPNVKMDVIKKVEKRNIIIDGNTAIYSDSIIRMRSPNKAVEIETHIASVAIGDRTYHIALSFPLEGEYTEKGKQLFKRLISGFRSR